MKPYKIVRESEGIIRQIAPNKSATNLISKDITAAISLATIETTNLYEKETTDYDRIYYVLAGELRLDFDNKSNVLRTGDACFISKNTTYEIRGSFKAIVINQPAFGSRQ